MRNRISLAAGAMLVATLSLAGVAGVGAAAQPSPTTPDTGSTSQGSAAISDSTRLAGMRILIVNDDSVQGTSASGRDGLGLYALRKSMCDAGADVITVGPWAVQSGMGGRMTLSGQATVQEVTPPAGYADDCGAAPSAGRVFGVCAAVAPCAATSPSASPSDAARVAITRFLPDNYWSDGPDLVLSGINFGQNDSLSVIHSGTVNAATVAHHLGVPAIAFSEELAIPCLRGDLAVCPEFTGAADFGVDLVEGLVEKDLVTPDLFLNVNYPHLAEGEQVGDPVLNILGECGALNFGFTGAVGAGGGTYGIGIVEACEEPRRNADTTALHHDQISIVPLDGDSTAAAPAGPVSAVVRGLGR